jgi:hypothetical protein
MNLELVLSFASPIKLFARSLQLWVQWFPILKSVKRFISCFVPFYGSALSRRIGLQRNVVLRITRLGKWDRFVQ